MACKDMPTTYSCTSTECEPYGYVQKITTKQYCYDDQGNLTEVISNTTTVCGC